MRMSDDCTRCSFLETIIICLLGIISEQETPLATGGEGMIKVVDMVEKSLVVQGELDPTTIKICQKLRATYSPATESSPIKLKDDEKPAINSGEEVSAAMASGIAFRCSSDGEVISGKPPDPEDPHRYYPTKHP